MADAPLTMLDIARRNNTDELAGLIDEAAGLNPEFRLGYARTINGTDYRTLVRTALPSVSFRAANTGSAVTKTTYINRLVQCFILDATWYVDKAVANASEDGPGAVCAQEGANHIESGIVTACSQFYYGTSNDTEGFTGLVTNVDSTMEVDVAGTGSATSSVWGVSFGPKDVAWVSGQNGQWTEGEIKEQLVTVDDKVMASYYQDLVGWMGLQWGSKYSFGRIKNISTAATLTDDHIADLLRIFLEHGKRPDMLLMTPRSLKQLQDSRTATNPTGAPAPFPSEAFGVPIEPTTSITNTETAS